MLGRIIGCISCMLCSLPFFYIVYFHDKKEPIGFWANDDSYKSKVVNVVDYNKEMVKMYKEYALIWVLAAVLCMIVPVIGYGLLVYLCTGHLYFLIRNYNKILNKYSK